MWLWDIDVTMDSVHKGPSRKKLKDIVWETLSRVWNVNEKLVCGEYDGNISSDETFYTPLGTLVKEGTKCLAIRFKSPFRSWLIFALCCCEATWKFETLELTISSSWNSIKTKSTSSS